MRLALMLIAVASLLATRAHAHPVQSRVFVDKPLALAGGADPLYVMLELEVDALAAPADRARPPLNLALVIDRSGSMSEQAENGAAASKMSYAIEAAQRFVDGLRDGDRVSVVEYDTEVTLLWPARALTPQERPRLRERIATLTPRASTNLAGGLLAGVASVEKLVSPGAITRVVLLSDGLANVGMTSPVDIGRRVAAARAAGVHVSSVGLGLAYDEDLMQTIAEAGGGQYYYVAAAKQLPAILEEELSLASLSVGKEVELVFEPSSAVRALDVFGFTATRDGARTRSPQPDLYAGEKRAVIVRIDPGVLAEGEHTLGSITLSYRDLASGQLRTLQHTLKITATKDVALIERSQNPKVLAEAALLEAARGYSESIRRYEAGDSRGAQANNDALIQDLQRRNTRLDDVRIKKKIEGLQLERERMQRADADASERSGYLKSSKQQAFGTLKGKSTSGKRGSDVLMEGASGFEVQRLEQALKALGMFAGVVDGVFDTSLTEAVKAFQAKHGLEADGVAGPMTLAKLGLY